MKKNDAIRDLSRMTVWAPNAKTVELLVHGESHSMEREEKGYWTSPPLSLPPGTTCSFRIDGSKPLPDPRSAFQPEGVHGPSEIIDHASFQWTDASFRQVPLKEAVIYELHVGTFTPEGTFLSCIEKLGHLGELGITHVELMPVAAFSGTRGWGYDGVDIHAPHQAYGRPEDLKKLIDYCHDRGIAVLLDVVYNHFGPEGNYLHSFGPYFTGRYHTPWGDAVNFDGEESDEVRRFFTENALMWLRDYHFDGLRLDAVHSIFDMSAVHILEELSRKVALLQEETGRPLVVIAESDLHDPRIIYPLERGGCSLSAQWNDDFHHVIHTLMTGETDGYYADFGNFSHMEKLYTEIFVYNGIYSRTRKKTYGRPVEGVEGDRFVVCIQNHDQVGNRARGERLSHLVPKEKLKTASLLLLTSPFVPLLFQGEEWAASSPFLYFTDHQDQGLAEAVRKGRRNEFREFGWKPEEVPDPQAEETFLDSKLHWEETREYFHSEILVWYTECLRVRKEILLKKDIPLADMRIETDEEMHTVSLFRGSTLTVANLSDSAKEISLPLKSSRWKVFLATDKNVRLSGESIMLPPWSGAFLASV